MLEYVLSVTRSVLKSSEHLYKLGVNSVNTYVKRSTFTRLLNSSLNLFACLLDSLLNSRGMNTSVGNKLFKCDSCRFTSYRVKSRKSDSLRCIVDNKLDTRKLFKHLNVSSLTSDYTTLHILVRKSNYRYSCLGNVVSRASLNSKRNYVLSLCVCFFLELRVKLVKSLSELVLYFIFNSRDKLFLSLLSRDSRNVFKYLKLFSQEVLYLLTQSFVFLDALFKLLVLFLKLLCFLIKIFFFLNKSSFLSCNLAASFLHLALGFVSLTKNFFFCTNQSLFLCGFGFLLGFCSYLISLELCRANLLFRHNLADKNTGNHTEKHANRSKNKFHTAPPFSFFILILILNYISQRG